jgi:hypothetical protein
MQAFAKPSRADGRLGEVGSHMKAIAAVLIARAIASVD